MEPYASVEDYVARYGEEIEGERLGSLLMDASRRISAELEAAGIDPAAKGEEYAERLAQVCRSMVHRCVDRHESDFGALPPGVTQFSQSAQDFSRSFSFANVYTEPKLTRDERRFLGLGGIRVGFVFPGDAE